MLLYLQSTLTPTERLAALVTDPVWWISVVAVGILINVASSYLKGWVDSKIAKRSEGKAVALAAKSEQFNNDVAWLKKHRGQIPSWLADSIDLRVTSNRFIVYCAIAIIFYYSQFPYAGHSMAVAIVPLFGWLAFFTSRRFWIKANYISAVTTAARKDIYPNKEQHNSPLQADEGHKVSEPVHTKART